MTRSQSLGLVALAAALLSSCGDTGKQAPPEGPATDAPSANAGAGAGGQPSSGSEPLACPLPQPGPSPLRRLGRLQLQNSLRTLLNDVPSIVTRLEPVLHRMPFGGLRGGEQEVSELTVDRHHELAHAAAQELIEPAILEAFSGCDAAASGDDACREQFLARVITRAFRRQPSQEDLADLRAVFGRGQELGGDFASGARAVLEVALQSPEFLYLIEQGAGQVQGEAIALTGYETASKLAYFLTGYPPDEALLTAAEAGPLGVAQVEAHARRLVGSPANRQLMHSFMMELLGLAPTTVQGPEYPTYTAPIAALTQQETARFIEDVIFEGAGTFQALFSEPSTWLNGPLAQFYGVPGVSGDAFQRVQLDTTQRAGILTQSWFLTSTSPGGSTRPVGRGIAVLRGVLCVELPATNPSAPVPSPEPVEGSTTRERLLASTAAPDCQSCHGMINPVGLAFENYDAVGLWRDTEFGKPIDASGTLTVTDAQGGFTSAVELVRNIAASRDARSCFAENWLTYAYGRPDTSADACAWQQIEEVLEASNGNIGELLVAIAKTDQFRYRLKSELP